MTAGAEASSRDLQAVQSVIRLNRQTALTPKKAVMAANASRPRPAMGPVTGPRNP